MSSDSSNQFSAEGLACFGPYAFVIRVIVHGHPRTSTESQPEQRSETERRETSQQTETLDPGPPIRQAVRVNTFN